MDTNVVTVSDCCKFIARISDTVLEIIDLSHSTTFRSYDLYDTVEKYLQIKLRQKPIFTHLQWEKVIPGSDSSKIGVIVDNVPLLIIFDFTNMEAEPIFIKQPRQEGIEYFEWIPPVSQEKEIGAYKNSCQLIVYSKLNLNAKVYSLDCTHILFTIYKPISSLIIRPAHDNRFWSIFANTLEYNVPPILYHFYNEGSISVLIQHIKLPQPISTAPVIKWSPSGSWLQLFNDIENIFGYHLMVFNLLGQILNDKTIKPLIDVECMSEGYTTSREDGHISLSNCQFESNWLNLELGNEMIIITSVQERIMEFQLVSMSLLRIEKVIKLNINNTQGWIQTSNGFTYRNITLPVHEEEWKISKISINNQDIFICINKSIIVHYKISAIRSDVSIGFNYMIQTSSSITNLEMWNDNLLIITEDEVHLASGDASKPKRIFRTRGTIKLCSIRHNQMVIIHNTTQGTNWQVVELEQSKQSPIKRKHLLGNISIMSDEVTDTFDNRKRIKTK